MDLKHGGPAEQTNPCSRQHSGFKGGPSGRGGNRPGPGRGSHSNSVNPTSSTGGRKEATTPVRIQPTHFLALPLHNHPSLMARINDFQKGLFSDLDGLNDDASEPKSTAAVGKRSKVTTVESSLVKGLDSSIVIDPRRLHMTLGVMALEQGDDSVEVIARQETTISEEPSNSTTTVSLMDDPSLSAIQSAACDPLLTPSQPPPSSAPSPSDQSAKRTVSTALSLLNSLKPRISEILNSDKGVKIPLEIMSVLKTEKMRIKKKGGSEGKKSEEKEVGEEGGRDDPALAHNDDMEKKGIGANVLYVAPEMKNKRVNKDLDKLIQVSNFVHQAFKDAGYLTDKRPLKLHCTVLNTSHRKGRFRHPFSYSDILVSDALRLLCEDADNSKSQPIPTEGNSFAGPELEPEEKATIQEGKSSDSIPANLAPQPNTSASGPDPSSSKALNVPTKSKGYSVMNNPTSVPVNLGVFLVEEIQLWVMGSHGPNNEYVSCGGVLLE